MPHNSSDTITTKQKRALLATEYFYPHWTGIAKTFSYVGENLKQQGYDVTVLTTQFNSNNPLSEEYQGLHIIRSPYQFRVSRTHYSLSILIEFIKLVSKFDLIVINSPNSNILFLTIFARLFGKQCIIYHQGDLTLPQLTGNHLKHKVIQLIFDCLTLPSMLLANVVSTYTADYAGHSRVMKYSMKKFRAYIPRYTLSNEVPSEQFSKKIEELQEKHILIGFAGRFVEEKAYDVLLKAIPEVVKSIPRAHFVFAGKTSIDYEPFYEYVEPLIEQIREHITFLGLLDKGDYRLFYASLETFVISSRSDCFPTTQIEAVLQHIPTVCTDIPGARMLVKETGYGEITNTEDHLSLAHGIITLIQNREKDKNFYEKKYANIEKFFAQYETFPTGL